MKRKDQKQINKNKKITNQKGQTREMKEEIGEIEEHEDVTKYGEFVSSYFVWLTLDRQKSKAKEIEDITKK